MDFEITSTSSKNCVKFTNRESEYVTATISGVVQATSRVCTYTDEFGLRNFLRKLADMKKPWNGKIEWSSLEEQFYISSTCSSLGSVVFYISMHGDIGSPEQWSAKIGITAEFGQLDAIADNAHRFYSNEYT
jgi:hypothetical protein